MSGQNVIPLDQTRRSRSAFLEYGTIAMLIFLVFDAMMVAGMVVIFLLTRAATGGAWPPAGQPWFPPWTWGAECDSESAGTSGSGFHDHRGH